MCHVSIAARISPSHQNWSAIRGGAVRSSWVARWHREHAVQGQDDVYLRFGSPDDDFELALTERSLERLIEVGRQALGAVRQAVVELPDVAQ